MDEPQAVSLKELTEVLCCSERNTKLVLRKMQERGWIAWQPGKGRGHKSQIIFYKKLIDLLQQQAIEWIEQGQLNRAIKLLDNPSLTGRTADDLRRFLTEQFGLHTEHAHPYPQDVIRIPFGRELSALDPLQASVTTEAHFSRQIFDSLVRFNLKTCHFEPHIAHSWICSPDQKQWTFYLRKGVRFHHGRELTAVDVLFTFHRIQAESSPCAWYFENLIGMEKNGRYAVTLTFSKPMGFLMHLLSSLHAAILPSDIGFQQNHMSGTGPFKLVQKSEDSLILERFEGYFREQALIDRIAVYRTDIKSDHVSFYPADHGGSYYGEETSHHYFSRLSGCRYLAFNFNKSGAQLDFYFRQAFRIICDRSKLIQELKGDREEPADSFFRKTSRKSSVTSLPLAKAGSLLEKSGYHGEMMQLFCFDQKGSIEDAEWLRRRAETVGLNLKIHPFAMTQFFDRGIDRSADLLLCGEIFEEDLELGFVSLLRDKTVFLRRFLNQDQRKVLDHLANRLMLCTDWAVRRKVIDETEDYIRRNLFILFNYHAGSASTFSKELAGIEMNAYGWADFSKLWIRPPDVSVFPIHV